MSTYNRGNEGDELHIRKSLGENQWVTLDSRHRTKPSPIPVPRLHLKDLLATTSISELTECVEHGQAVLVL